MVPAPFELSSSGWAWTVRIDSGSDIGPTLPSGVGSPTQPWNLGTVWFVDWVYGERNDSVSGLGTKGGFSGRQRSRDVALDMADGFVVLPLAERWSCLEPSFFFRSVSRRPLRWFSPFSVSRWPSSSLCSLSPVLRCSSGFFKWSRKFANENKTPIGVGADRLVGEVGPVLAEIPGGPTRSGMVRLGTEDWPAESDSEKMIPDGAVVRVVEVRGTRVIVTPTISNGRKKLNMAFLIVLAAIALMMLVFLAAAVKIVRPYQRGIVERLGKFKGTVEPGLQVIIPFLDKIRIVDMREQVVDVPPQEVITKDNVVVAVDAVVFYEPTDPRRLVYNIANFVLAITKLAQTNLRNLIGELDLDSALTSRDVITTSLREILDDATDKWGVRVVRVEIQRIDPPPEVVSANARADESRTPPRRAVVTRGQRRA